MGTTCEISVYKNLSYYKNSSNGELIPPKEMLASICPNDCSNHGNCSNSTCICDEDYTAKDCAISLKGIPNLFNIKKSGLCDVRRRLCQNVVVYGNGFLDSKSLTCHIVEQKVTLNIQI